MSEVHEGDIYHRVTIPELQNRENARWLALLLDTEGAIGWFTAKETVRKDRLDEEYRYEYRYTYAHPYISIGMTELESKRTIDLAAMLMGVTPMSREKYPYEPVREAHVEKGRALAVVSLIKPYLDKFSRMAQLVTVLFKHRTHIPADRFMRVLTNLFGKPVSSREANDIILRMTETEFTALTLRANEQADYT